MEDIVNKATVFSSTIKRTILRNKNNLYDLLSILPAKPITPTNDPIKYNCDFCPRTDKFYIPKRKSRLKVKTVRDIRKAFEEDTYAYLPGELEKQQNVLLKKISHGSSRDESTKTLAKNIIKSEIPISRSTWQMLVNLNPEQYSHPKQFVIWKGKNIQVNGSKGGNEKYICHYDMAYSKLSLKKSNVFKKIPLKKKGLLRNSLAVKFKPGPLRKKMLLDDSHQKYHVGDIELAKLPKPGLDIYPTFGTALEPTITNFLYNLRNEDGSISPKWAELTLSVLGTLQKSGPVQIDKGCVTFDLNYKCGQRKILMRRDIDVCDTPKPIKSDTIETRLSKDEVVILPEIKDMMEKMLDCVEITIEQDNMYVDEDAFQEVTFDKVKENQTHMKEKLKRKYCELDRLDVTVIHLPEESKTEIAETCDKPFCSLGCVCDSLGRVFHLRGHCGLVDCMFDCKCDFSKYTAKDSLDMECPELIPELLNLKHGFDLKLAKEEQKFHQTVILTGEKSILLKSQKRNAKAPKKYAHYYKNTNHNDKPKKQWLSVVALKINCENIEPWCMVHKLYKCFCKGKFTEVNDTATKETFILKDINYNSNSSCEKSIEISDDAKVVEPTSANDSNTESLDRYANYNNKSTCSRVIVYAGRKYSDEYYKHTNNKILNMEKNDSKLRQKMISMVYGNDPKERERLHSEKSESTSSTSTNLDQFLSGVDELISKPECSRETRSKSKLLSNKTKLVAWLESNYKMYKNRIDRGITKTSLDPPKAGKVALYPWDFILSRYRERKNFFLISKQKPFRIFMAVNTKSSHFDTCININNIRFAELHNYPVTVKNLLTNATDLKDNFCILCGLSDCWELIGSVSKINTDQENSTTHKESSDIESTEMFNINPTWGDKSSLENRLNDKQSFDIIVDDDKQSTDTSEEDDQQSLENIERADDSAFATTSLESEEADTSKWFVMTVENDFSEIRFYKRGFFVKYESIVKAINVARMSGKTVRLSSQKCIEKHSGPQFGIYAIPNANEYCVFVGPYEIKDSLGIETIKTVLDVRKLKRTRGFWIKTNKVDNLKVIDNPLSFMNTLQNSAKVPLDFHFEASNEMDLERHKKDRHKLDTDIKSVPSTSKEPITNMSKPIKIRKSNGFYHLDSNGLLKKNILPKSGEPSESKSLLKNSGDTAVKDILGKLLKITNTPYKIIAKPKTTPDVSPIKISAVYSTINEDKDSKSNRPEKGMFILKPEEINRKIENRLVSISVLTPSGETCDLSLDPEGQIDMDIEQFANASTECNRSNDEKLDDVYIISDDEDDTINEDKTSYLKEVWIICANKNLGWIRGKRNLNNDLSFKLSYDRYSEYYSEQVALEKVNEILSTAVGLPHADVIWKVVDSEDELKGSEIKIWESSHILKKQKLQQSNLKTYSRTRSKTAEPTSKKNSNAQTSTSGSIIHEDLPFKVSSENSSELIDSIVNAPDNLKHAMTETLKTILSMAQDIDK